MKIGVIGTGNIGGQLARSLIGAGHEVRVANSRGVEGVRKFADEIGAQAADIRGAVKGVDVIILSIPFPVAADLPNDLFEGVPESVPIVDTSNYYPGLRDSRIPEIDAGQVESVWVSEQLARPVTKAFNNILAHSLANLGRPKGAEGRLAIAVAGSDVGHKRTVMTLIDEIGFDPVDGGPLEESWRQQPGTPSYCCDWDAEIMSEALTAAVKGEAAHKRDQLPELFATLGRNPNHAEIVALNRSHTGMIHSAKGPT